MDEVREVADRVTVLRSGSTVGTLDGDAWTTEEVVRLMTGHANQVAGTAAAGRVRGEAGDVVLETRGLHLRADSDAIDFTLRSGEIVGLAGLEGQGQDAFLRALWGLGSEGGTVTRITRASRIPVTSKYAARRGRIAYVPRERRAESIFDWMSIVENFAAATLRKDRRGLFLSRGASLSRFKD
ncbi:MAG TPA: hypothetical protein VNQ52_07440 [Microbacteriaceae bacterium]|nr:hypothetical protein [Microbacteriaceae bacterium]